MISIRPYEEQDSQNLLSIEELCPQGNKTCAMGVKKRDIIARYQMYDNCAVIVAEMDGRAAGWTGWTIKDKHAYLAEVMVHPEFRRFGVATRLVEEAEINVQEAGAEHIYCYIYEPNDASKTLFSGLGYSNVANIKNVEMPVYKRIERSTSFEIEGVQENDINAIELINSYNRNNRHYVPFDEESFASHLQSMPGYGPDNFWVVKDQGEVVACAGLWDCSTIAEFCYTQEPASWKIMGAAFRLLGKVMKLPKIVKEGEYFQFHYLVDYAFDRRNSEAMQSLLEHLNNVLLEWRRDYFVAMVDPSDSIFTLLKKREPQIETTHVFAKPLDGKLPDFSPFYVDIRDAIL